jgi:hypothetical protein
MTLRIQWLCVGWPVSEQNSKLHGTVMNRAALSLLAALLFLGGCHDQNNPTSSTNNTPPPPPAAVAPSITAQPADQSVTSGQSASFSVTATGTAPLTYQWQRNAVTITGATNNSYALSSTAVADSGAKFSVVVSNSAGSVTSSAATLTVTAAGKLVGSAAGGSVTSADGRITLNIPAGALTADATVNIASASDAVVPSALAKQFTTLSGWTYRISTQGGNFVPGVLLRVSFAAATLPQPRRLKKLSTQGAGSSPSADDLGLSEDCGDGKPVTVIIAPKDGYDSDAFIAGCPDGFQSGTTVSGVSWTVPAGPSGPANNNLWENFTARTADTIGYTADSIYRGAATGGDTWTGATVVSAASSQVGFVADPNFTQEQSLLTVVGATGGHLIVQQQLANPAAALVLDGPGNVYAIFGPGGVNYNYVARYQIVFAADGSTSLRRVWEVTLAGAPTAADGTHADPLDTGAAGVNFGRDPNSGDLLALVAAGNNGMTNDEKARLGFTADGFVVRINDAGGLVWAAPLTPVKPYDSNRAAFYTMHVDHLGNAYVAGACMATASGDCSDPNGPGLALAKIDSSGTLAWMSSIASPDEIGQIRNDGVHFPMSEIGVDNSNDAYLTYRRFSVPYDTDGGASGHLHVTKVAGSDGGVTSIGDVDPAADPAGGDLNNRYGSSYVDDNGNLYIFSLIGPFFHDQISVLDPTLKLTGNKNLSHFQSQGDGDALPGIFQIDSSGKVFEQYAGSFQNALTPNVCGSVSAGFICYGQYLREFHF